MTLSLGPWRLLRPLAAGGMGEVWLAEHATARVPAAVKRLRVSEPRLLAALRNEVRAIAALDHPGVVEVLDHGDDPEPYLVLELVDGGSLAERPPSGAGALRRTLLDVLDALAHAHARGVLHRDLKPANLLVGRDGRTRLADFGIAHALSDAHPDQAPSGTLAFMAPEQLLGDLARQGPPTDLYALGCTAFLLATGEPPFPVDAVAGHLGFAPPPLVPLFPVPPGFEAWVRRLLEKDPDHRYRSAAEAAFALRSLPEAPGDASPLPPGPLPVTLTLPAPREVPATAFRSDRAPAPVQVPPLPEDWREGPRPPRVLGPTLSLIGLRPPRLVGREAEQDLLWGLLRAGGTRAVSIDGPRGIGRTRLAAFLTQRAHECGARVERGGTAPLEPGPPDDRAWVVWWDERPADWRQRVATAARRGLQVLLLATAPPGPAEPDTVHVRLAPLAPTHRRALIRELLDTSDGLAAQLEERTGGHPRFAVELVRGFVRRGLVVPGPSGLRMADDATPELPEDETALWRARVDPRPADEERALVLAALLGAELAADTWTAASVSFGLRSPDPDRAVDEGLVTADGERLALDPTLREHLLSRRTGEHPAMHAAIAAILPPDRDHAVGHHWWSAGRPDLAVAPLARAAVRAGQGVDQGAAEAACELWERALTALGVPEADERWAALHRRRIGIATDTARLDLAEALATAARDRADRFGWSSRARIEPRLHLANLYERRALPDQARDQVAEALALVETETPDEVRHRIACAQVSSALNAGRPREALEVAEQALAGGVADPVLRGELLRHRSGAALRLGQLDRAAEGYAQAVAVFVEHGAVRLAAGAEAEAATVAHLRGDWATAERGYRRAVEALSDGNEETAWSATANLAIVLVLLGRSGEAASWIDRLLPRVTAARHQLTLLYLQAARWATLAPGPAWDEAADTVARLQAESRIEDPDFVLLAEAAARRVTGERAERARRFADERRRATA